MRKLYVFLLIASITGCAVKQTQNQLSSGDYDEAIETATDNLRNNKDKKRKQDYIYLLEEAFAKAKNRDERNISLWTKESNPNNLEKIYRTYMNMEARQEKIRPLLPLQLIDKKRNAIFPFEDYSKEIVKSKEAYSDYLYNNSVALSKSSDKNEIRKAYDDLNYLNQINPGFRNTKKIMDDLRFKGTDFVSVYTKNDSGMAIPSQLESDLLDFSTLGLDDKWTVYHSNRLKDVNYDYGVVINFRNILISPEHVKEKEFKKEREIKDGRKKLLDRNGNVVRDSSGNVVMVDNLKTVRATIFEFRQSKSCQVTAKVDYIDFKNNQMLRTFPLASEFVFDHIYATYRGDKRAADDDYRHLFDKKPVPFPSNEQMVYDTGEDLKAKLKSIIRGNRLKR